MNRLHQTTVVVKRHQNSIGRIPARDNCYVRIFHNLVYNGPKAIPDI